MKDRRIVTLDNRFRIVFVAAIVAILVFSSISLLPRSTAFRIYDFTDTVNNTAYYGSNEDTPPSDRDIGDEFPDPDGDSEYEDIASSDDIHAYWGDGEWYYPEYHRFRFRIFEDPASIEQIIVTHEGYGSAWTEPDVGDEVPGLILYVWNYGASTPYWELMDEHDVSDWDALLRIVISRGVSDYISVDGYIDVLVQVKGPYGSCPFLFTWDGEEFIFVADMYGHGIIGDPGDWVDPSPEDYAKIDGDLLEPEEGVYRVQITQEYDEISYLDELNLIAIDHSADVEVFPSLVKDDELGRGKVYTVSKSLDAPLMAVDEDGKNVFDQIAEKDGIYTAGGQNELNALELNLGDLSDAEEIKLVVSAYTHWIPGSSTEEEESDENYIQVKDENGNWINVYGPYDIIYPAALPRTYVLDLTGMFVTDDYTVRIAYNQNVKFDYVGLDTSAQQEFEVNILPPAYADLHFRGYSNLNGLPATPDYYDLDTSPPVGFSSPTGDFTRFGDVLSLLLERDDKYVIMHHGDEISVNFNYIPVPEGMERDLILYSWGQYKNRYYETGGTVEPLPFQGMSNYPYPADESYPYDEEHLAYLEEYNTREYSESTSNIETKEHYSIETDYVKVEVITAPVGGEIAPITAIALLPWIALIGAAAAIAVVALGYTITRRRPILH